MAQKIAGDIQRLPPAVFFQLVFIPHRPCHKGEFLCFGFSGNVPFLNLLLLYTMLSSPVCLIEYIYLLNNRSHRILQYGLYTFAAQLAMIIVPVLTGRDIIWSVYGLL